MRRVDRIETPKLTTRQVRQSGIARAVILALTFGGLAGIVVSPAAASRLGAAVQHRRYCDPFGNWVLNTSCREETRVWRLYSEVCVPASWPATRHLPRCRRRTRGFRCTPTGDVYAFIYCGRDRARMGFHLAE